jgi:hypothetical protein
LTRAAIPPPAAADSAVDQLAAFVELELALDEFDVDELELDEPPQAATAIAAPTAPAANSARLPRRAHEIPPYRFKVPPRYHAAPAGRRLRWNRARRTAPDRLIGTKLFDSDLGNC